MNIAAFCGRFLSTVNKNSILTSHDCEKYRRKKMQKVYKRDMVDIAVFKERTDFFTETKMSKERMPLVWKFTALNFTP